MTDKFRTIAEKAAIQAGKVVFAKYGHTTVTMKPDHSPVTNSDLDSEKLITSLIHKNFPDHSIISEEAGPELKDSEYTWIVDPLDGTRNYSVKIPFFCVSIALIKDQQPILGVIYYPVQKELFTAELGKGSYLNQQPIKINKDIEFETAFITIANARDKISRERAGKFYLALKPINYAVRQVGSVALELCYVGAGRFGATVMVACNSWDIMAGALIVKEAGGIVTDFNGKPFDKDSIDILASSPTIYQNLLKLVNETI